MALPNPELTHQVTPWSLLLDKDGTGFLAALGVALGALTGDNAWTGAPAFGSTPTNTAIVISPPATSPILTKFSIIFGVGSATLPAAAQCLDGNAVALGVPCCAFGGQYVTGTNWYAASPFGAGVRSSGFAAQVCPAITATAIHAVMVIASAETIFIGIQLDGLQQQFYGQWFGAIIEPPDLASAETGAAATGGERLLGMFTTGNVASTALGLNNNPTTGMISTTFNGFGLDNNGAGVGKGAIFDPRDDTALLRMEMVRTWATPSAFGMGKTLGGNPFFRAIYVTLAASPYTALGRARGLCFYDRARMGEIIQDPDGTDRGYIISGNAFQACEALAFTNPAA